MQDPLPHSPTPPLPHSGIARSPARPLARSNSPLLSRRAFLALAGCAAALPWLPGRAAAQTLVWQRHEGLAPSPSSRRDHSLTFIPGANLLLLFGGRAANAALGDLWAFDLGHGEWRELSPGPGPRWGHGAAYDPARGRLILTHGQDEGGFWDDTWAYEVASDSWQPLAVDGPRPPARYGFGIAADAVGMCLYLTHGFTDDGRFDDTWHFDLPTDVWHELPIITERPRPRCLTRAWLQVHPDRLILYAGQSDDDLFLPDLWALDHQAGVWERIEPGQMPLGRNLYAAAHDPTVDRTYVFGGATAAGLQDDLWLWDRERWQPLSAAFGPGPRSGHDAAFSSDLQRLWLFGGAPDPEPGTLWELSLGGF